MKNRVLKVAEVRLIYKTKIRPSDRVRIKTSTDAHNIFIQGWNQDTLEHVAEFKILLLNRSNMALGTSQISLGGTAGTVTDVKLIFQYALKTNAQGIIICHNHPSGNNQPSESDKKITDSGILELIFAVTPKSEGKNVAYKRAGLGYPKIGAKSRVIRK